MLDKILKFHDHLARQIAIKRNVSVEKYAAYSHAEKNREETSTVAAWHCDDGELACFSNALGSGTRIHKRSQLAKCHEFLTKNPPKDEEIFALPPQKTICLELRNEKYGGDQFGVVHVDAFPGKAERLGFFSFYERVRRGCVPGLNR